MRDLGGSFGYLCRHPVHQGVYVGVNDQVSRLMRRGQRCVTEQHFLTPHCEVAIHNFAENRH